MTRNPVGWFEIYVEDLDRARRFYEAVLDTTLTHLDASAGGPPIEMWAFPMADGNGGDGGPGASGALVKMAGMGPASGQGGNGVLVYFSSEDCAVEAGRVAAKGGKVLREKTSIGDYGHMALFTDSEGNTVGLHSMQ